MYACVYMEEKKEGEMGVETLNPISLFHVF